MDMKKIITVVLLLVLLVSFAGCTGTSPGTTIQNKEQVNEEIGDISSDVQEIGSVISDIKNTLGGK
ncbi:MAG: hypothetical protein HY832_03875 [Candidatus Aenigmarchaeota archaeon]|nr:hypothetical protein [Candidatus Aenigmarchaeota archaeon]